MTILGRSVFGRAAFSAMASAALLAACAPTETDTLAGRVSGAAPAEGADAPSDEIHATDKVVGDLYAGETSSDEASMGLAAAGGPLVYYLNRLGRSYTAGRDDAANGVSSVLQFEGRAQATLPAASLSDSEWSGLKSCMAEELAPYNVQLTDQKPATTTYSELIVSNTTGGSALGLPSGVVGVAPLGSCRVIPKAVGFVFHAMYNNSSASSKVRGICEAAVHEIGHTLSLSHEQISSDLMSYSPMSINKGFQNVASACGTAPGQSENCSCGGATQNSHQQLLTLVGANSGTPGTPPSTPPTSTPPSTGGGGSSSALTASMTFPSAGATLTGNAAIKVVVEAKGDAAVKSAELNWLYSQRVLPCDNSVRGVTCTALANRYTWTIQAGTGSRTFNATITDTAGHTVTTPSVSITLTTSTSTAPPPPSGGTTPPSTTDPAQVCVDTINQYRATLGLPPYARWSGAEACASQQAQNDASVGRAHAAFGKCGEIAQNEGRAGGPPERMIKGSLSRMWAEGPGGGHYEEMRGSHKQVACGFYVQPDGTVWATQDYR